MMMMMKVWTAKRQMLQPGTDIQWGNSKVLNTCSRGHRLQWFKGALYCSQCGAWTAHGGRPKI
eukprot:11679667-Karenia_brevis.AAC.1